MKGLQSPAALVAQFLHFLPVEGWRIGIFQGELMRALAYSLECGLHLLLILMVAIRHQPGDGLSVAGNHDLLTVFHAVEQRSQRILGLESPHLLR
jgi:hypothetical protein